MTPLQAETETMAHRFLYYVLSESVISDAEYDVLEKASRAICPFSSPVHGVGSSLASSYTREQTDRAQELLCNT